MKPNRQTTANVQQVRGVENKATDAPLRAVTNDSPVS